ncbi:MAG: hypothetical protein Q9160_008227 [Pyrenula sp. 1 TL-2023]
MTRLTRRRLFQSRLLRLALLLFAIWSSADVLYVRSNIRAASINASKDPASLPPRPTKVYIASIHWNNEDVLRSHWNNAVVKLAEALGPENIYISIHESGSWDDSKGALKLLDEELAKMKVRRTVTLDATTHQDELDKPPALSGWIETPRGKTELRRIPYLARLRNQVLQPLENMAADEEKFDKILFLNDVVFTTQDVLTLMDTNKGKYAAACSLDFSKPPNYYDTFALRDTGGWEHVTQSWPYFRSKKSRQAMKRSVPVPVSSCWNGMVIMDSTPFYQSPKPLRFRGTPDTLATLHLEGSECCLVHADNPLSSTKGVWLNPNVRVGYNGPAYDAVHREGGWLSTYEIFTGLWRNRFRRWTTTSKLKAFVVSRRLSKWAAEKRGENRNEPGVFCLINEMQVLIWNGWAHV